MRWTSKPRFRPCRPGDGARRAAVAAGAAGLAMAAAGELIPSSEPGWPQWRGRWRDGVVRDAGPLADWPEGGPPRRWSVGGLGRGWSSPIISGGRMFITGDAGDALEVRAFDLDGRLLWLATNGAAWKGSYPGARASCALAGGRLFLLNAHGRLAAFDAASGRELWAVDVLDRFDGQNIRWALSECLLVDGDRVIVTAGGARALIAALHVRDGATVWQSEPLRLGPSPSPRHQRVPEPAGEVDPAGYTSPILCRIGGLRVIVNCSNRHAFGVDADTGRLLWTRPLPTRFQVLACMPALWRDCVFVTGPDGGGGRLVRMAVEGSDLAVQDVWTVPMDTAQHGVVVAGDRLLGPFYRDANRWVALDLDRGEVVGELKGLTRGASIRVGERLWIVTEDGEAVRMAVAGREFRIESRFRITEKPVRDCWAHPVLLDGRLYLRYHDTLTCHDAAAR